MRIILKIIINRPGTVLLAFGLLLIIAVMTTGLLRFDQDIFRVFPQHNRRFQVLVHAFKSSLAQDRIFLLVEGPDDPQQLIADGKRFVEDINLIHINGKPAFNTATILKSEALSVQKFKDLLLTYLKNPGYFLTEEDLPRLYSLLGSTGRLEDELKRSLALLSSPGTSEMAGLASLDPLNLRSFLMEKLRSMQQGLAFAPGPYLLSPDKRTLLIIAQPSLEARKRGSSLSVLNKIDKLRGVYPSLKIGITGGYPLAAQEEALVKGDLVECLAGSVLGIAALFFFAYRNFMVLSFIFLPLGVGLQFALGAMTLLLGRIHLLAIAFATVVLGLGIDFVIHVYDRFTTERQSGRGLEKATELSVIRTGSAVVTGGVTTLTAFLVLVFTDIPILYQIGWLVALGLVFCLVTVLVALPAWLIWLEKRPSRKTEKSMSSLGMYRVGRYVNRYPGPALVLSLIMLAVTLPGLFQVQFEQELMELRPKGIEAVELQEDLLNAFGTERDYVLIAWGSKDSEGLWTTGQTVDELMEGFKENGLISSWVSLTKLASRKPLHLEGVRLEEIKSLFMKYGLRLEDFGYTYKFLKSLIKGEECSSSPLYSDLKTQDLAGTCNKLKELPKTFHRFFFCDKDGIQGIAWARVKGEDGEMKLKNELSGERPDLMVINPRLAVGDLVAQVQSQLWIKIFIVGSLILLILGLYFRDISAIPLVLIPVTLGLITTAGALGFAGVSLNIFNFVVFPILIGIGLDDGIHIFRRYQELPDIEKTLGLTGRSVLMTTLTTICGFGSLSLAEYHVLKGMGLMAVFGVGTCFVFSVVTLPAILKLVKER